VDHAPVRRLLERARHQPPLPSLARQRTDRASTAFDLPTQIGYDSDHELASPEIGLVGVPINSLADIELLFEHIPLGEVSTSMTINATASILLCMYVALARRAGVARERIRGTVQNDILKEYAARGNYRFPAAPSMRLVTDLMSFCQRAAPSWNTISISGYHIREAGSSAVQEIAFTLANGRAYVQAAIAAGLAVDDFAPRLSFFFNAHNHLFEEVAKFRAARRMWARIVREEFGAKDPESWMLRFHTQTAGSTLTSQQPDNNVVRVTVQALAAILGGTQSLHTNSRDEALSVAGRELGAARVAHAASAGARIRRRGRGRSARRLAVHRSADRRARSARARSDGRDREARRRGGGDRAGLRAARDPSLRDALAARGRAQGARRRRRQRVHDAGAAAEDLPARSGRA
jgi:methylmalonyl-CoA mutase cobalamin-binding domain/chain